MIRSECWIFLLELVKPHILLQNCRVYPNLTIFCYLRCLKGFHDPICFHEIRVFSSFYILMKRRAWWASHNYPFFVWYLEKVKDIEQFKNNVHVHVTLWFMICLEWYCFYYSMGLLSVIYFQGQNCTFEMKLVILG